MAFLSSFDLVGSALTAERYRTDIILQNIANSESTTNANGDPYRRKQVVFQERPLTFKQVLDAQKNPKLVKQSGTGGVQVVEVVENQSDFVPVYDPTHPYADEEGYVMKTNVNRTEEQIDLMAASNAYDANLTALSVLRAMTMKALEIGK